MAAAIVTSEVLASNLEKSLADQLEALPEPNRGIAHRALANGFLCVEPNLEHAVVGADRCAPEHLEIATIAPEALSKRIKMLVRSFSASVLRKFLATMVRGLIIPFLLAALLVLLQGFLCCIFYAHAPGFLSRNLSSSSRILLHLHASKASKPMLVLPLGARKHRRK